MNVLVIGNFQQTITIIRSLARNGFGVVVAKPSAEPVYTQYSRHVSGVWLHPSTDSALFVPALLDCLKEKDIRCIVPVGDADHLLVSALLDVLPATVSVVTPRPEVLQRCLDKETAYQAARQAGIPLPRQQVAHTLEEVHAAATAIGFPCIVKPVDSSCFFWGKKAIRLQSPQDLRTALTSWPEGNEQLLVQEFATGQRHNCDLLASGGELCEYFELKVLRTNCYDGTGLFVDGVTVAPDPRLRDYCAALLRELHYHGPAMIQFHVDEERGTIRFLEINPRFDAFVAVAYNAGYEFPLLAVQQALGLRPEAAQPSRDYRTGLRVQWLLGDLRGWWNALAEHEIVRGEVPRWLGNIAVTTLCARRHVTWNWRDPLPTLYLFAVFLRGCLNGILHQLRRRVFRGRVSSAA